MPTVRYGRPGVFQSGGRHDMGADYHLGRAGFPAVAGDRLAGVFLTRSSSIVSWPTLRSSAAPDDAGLCLFIVRLATIELRQP